MPVFVDLAGQRFGRLLVVQRVENTRQGAARWLCACVCGRSATVVAGDLRRRTRSCGCIQREHAAALGRATPERSWACYSGAHERLRRQRGRAALHACADCGGPAAEWSLRPDAAVTYPKDPARPEVSRYSLNVADYEPRCKPCHEAHDKQIRQVRNAA